MAAHGAAPSLDGPGNDYQNVFNPTPLPALNQIPEQVQHPQQLTFPSPLQKAGSAGLAGCIDAPSALQTADSGPPHAPGPSQAQGPSLASVSRLMVKSGSKQSLRQLAMAVKIGQRMGSGSSASLASQSAGMKRYTSGGAQQHASPGSGGSNIHRNSRGQLMAMSATVVPHDLAASSTQSTLADSSCHSLPADGSTRSLPTVSAQRRYNDAFDRAMTEALDAPPESRTSEALASVASLGAPNKLVPSPLPRVIDCEGAVDALAFAQTNHPRDTRHSGTDPGGNNNNNSFNYYAKQPDYSSIDLSAHKETDDEFTTDKNNFLGKPKEENSKVSPTKNSQRSLPRAVGTALLVIKKLIIDVWSPTEPIRLMWDLIMLSLLLYVVYITPYIVAFGISTASFVNPVAYADITVNGLFMFDVILNFRTAYSDVDGKLVFVRKLICWNYITGWFWIDTATSLPWDNMFGDQYGMLKVLRLLRIIRLVKVFKVFRMMRLSKVLWARELINLIDKIVENLVTRMTIFVLIAFCFVHWAACMFYYVAKVYGEDTVTWITTIEAEAVFLDEQSPNVGWYAVALYWAVTTMTTVGYGDITGVQIGEKVVAMVAMVLGASIFAYFMASLATLVAAMNNTNVRVTRKKAFVKDFLHSRKIPGRLAQKVRDYFEYVLDRQLHSDEAALISELPSSLRRQLMWHMHREALEKVPFFQGKDSYFLTALVPYLKLEYYSPGDIIVRQNETGHEMFFIAEGVVEARIYSDSADDMTDKGLPRSSAGQPIKELSKARHVLKRILGRREDVKLLDEDLVSNPYQPICKLVAGQYFGEYTCFFGETRVATVVAETFCELYSLSNSDIELVQEHWPDLEQDLSLLLNNNPMTWESEAYEARNQLLRVPSTTCQYDTSVTVGGGSEYDHASQARYRELPTTGNSSCSPDFDHVTPRQQAVTHAASPPQSGDARGEPVASEPTFSVNVAQAGGDGCVGHAGHVTPHHRGSTPQQSTETAQIMEQLRSLQQQLAQVLSGGRRDAAVHVERERWPVARIGTCAPEHPLLSTAITSSVAPLNQSSGENWPVFGRGAGGGNGPVGARPSVQGLHDALDPLPRPNIFKNVATTRVNQVALPDYGPGRHRTDDISVRRGRVNVPLQPIPVPKVPVLTKAFTMHQHAGDRGVVNPSPKPLPTPTTAAVTNAAAGSSPSRDAFLRRAGLPSSYDPGSCDSPIPHLIVPKVVESVGGTGRSSSAQRMCRVSPTPPTPPAAKPTDDKEEADREGGGDALVTAMAKKQQT